MSQPNPAPASGAGTVSAPVSSDEIRQLLADPGLPEGVRRALAGGATLERIVLDAEGQWWHQGEPFRNEGLIALFHRSIRRTEGGTYVLSIPPFSYPITVADTPRQVRHVRLPAATEGAEAAVLLVLSDGTEQALDPQTLAYVPDRGLYCRVQAPDGQHWLARFLRPAYYALGELLTSETTATGETYWLELPTGRAVVPTRERVQLG